MIGSSIGAVEILLLISGVVAVLAKRLRVPYTVGLVLAGGVLALLPVDLKISLSPDLILLAFLPPLIFEAALHLRWPELRRELPIVVALAAGGVLLSAAVTAAGMHYLGGWSWAAAAIFGALISATDPVSVVATFKEAGVQGRLRLLVESESLLNDGAAAVLFVVITGLVGGGQVHASGVALNFAMIVFGGIACGAAMGGLVLLIAGRTADPMIEITFTTVAAYGAFLGAEHLQVSGVMATLTAGLMVGNLGPLGAISERGRVAVVSFWEYAAFVANSLIFILIGIQEAKEPFGGVWLDALLAIVVVLMGRAVAVYPIAALFGHSASQKISAAFQHILVWGGLRGALALALAQGLPLETPGRSTIVTVTFAVVAFSIIVQGLTMTPLLRQLKVLAAERG